MHALPGEVFHIRQWNKECEPLLLSVLFFFLPLLVFEQLIKLILIIIKQQFLLQFIIPFVIQLIV